MDLGSRSKSTGLHWVKVMGLFAIASAFVIALVLVGSSAIPRTEADDLPLPLPGTGTTITPPACPAQACKDKGAGYALDPTTNQCVQVGSSNCPSAKPEATWLIKGVPCYEMLVCELPGCPTTCKGDMGMLTLPRVKNLSKPPMNADLVSKLDLATAKCTQRCGKGLVRRNVSFPLPLLNQKVCPVSICVPQELSCMPDLKAVNGGLKAADDPDLDGVADLLEFKLAGAKGLGGKIQSCVNLDALDPDKDGTPEALDLVTGSKIKLRLNVESFHQHNEGHGMKFQGEMDNYMDGLPHEFPGEPYFHNTSYVSAGTTESAQRKTLRIERFERGSHFKEQASFVRIDGQKDGTGDWIELVDDVRQWATKHSQTASKTSKFGKLSIPAITVALLLLDHDNKSNHSTYLNSQVRVDPDKPAVDLNTVNLLFYLSGTTSGVSTELPTQTKDVFKGISLTDPASVNPEKMVTKVSGEALCVAVPDGAHLARNLKTIRMCFSIEFQTALSACKLNLVRQLVPKLDATTKKLKSVLSSVDGPTKAACGL